MLATQESDRLLGCVGAGIAFRAQLRYSAIRKTESLRFVQRFVCQCRFAANVIFILNQAFDFVQEPPVDLRQVLNLLKSIPRRNASAIRNIRSSSAFNQTLLSTSSLSSFAPFK